MNEVIEGQAAGAPPLALAGKMDVIPGFIPGLSYPGLRAVILLGSEKGLLADLVGRDTTALLARVDSVLELALPDRQQRRPVWHVEPLKGLLQRLLYWTGQVQRQTGMPLAQDGRIVGLDASGSRRAVLVFATLDRKAGAAAQAFTWVLAAINKAWGGGSCDDVLEGLSVALAKISKEVPSGSNTVRFLQAAQKMGVPVCHISARVYQFGQGARSRWLDSSFTDCTSSISAKIARNKQQAAAVLRRGGLPVPAHQLVSTQEQALAVAARLGYPVVVKPANLDGGVGVAAGLHDEEQLCKAFAGARKYSSQLLVEKHIYGNDYRLTVLHGELIWAIERVPGGVTGDGVRTLLELVEEVNRNPDRGVDAHSPLQRLDFNEEAIDLLAQEGLNGDSVLKPGQFVRLRRTANVANGGVPVAVLDQVHPDNRLLAERAARILRLDLAGVDLLIPDIARSWQETGAAVCEVNGQPNIGQTTAAHLYGVILSKLLVGNGRIPVIMVVGDGAPQNFSRVLVKTFTANGKTVGYATDRMVAVGGQTLLRGKVNLFTAAQGLLTDTAVEAVVLAVNGDDLLRSGLPFDRIDALVVAGDRFNVSTKGEIPSSASNMRLEAFVQQLLPIVGGRVYVSDALSESVVTKDLLGDARLDVLSTDTAVAVERLIQHLTVV